MISNVGGLIISKKTNKFLLLKRSKHCTEAHTWSLLSGGVDEGENNLDALKREIKEEINVNLDNKEFNFINQYTDGKSLFYFYHIIVEDEFECVLDTYENVEYKWCEIDNLPSPLHKYLPSKLKTI